MLPPGSDLDPLRVRKLSAPLIEACPVRIPLLRYMYLSRDRSPAPHLQFCSPLTTLQRRWHLRCQSRKIHSLPVRKPVRLLAAILVCKRNSIVRIRPEVGISFEVPERLCRLGDPMKGG